MTLMCVELKFYFIFISSSNGQRTKRPVFCYRSAAKLLDPSAFIDSEKLFYFGQGLTIFMVNENLPPIEFSDLATPNLTTTLRELYSLTWTTYPYINVFNSIVPGAAPLNRKIARPFLEISLIPKQRKRHFKIWNNNLSKCMYLNGFRSF